MPGQPCGGRLLCLQLPKLLWLTLTFKVEYGGASGEGPHRMVHARELASLLGRLAQRRPDLDVGFAPTYV